MKGDRAPQSSSRGTSPSKAGQSPSARGRTSAAERRSAILRGSIDVFWHKGYAGANLRLIAEAAGMEKGHLTYYFKTKDDLLYEVVNDLQDQFADRLALSLAADGDPLTILHRVLRQHVGLACVHYRQTSVAYDNMRFLSPQRRVLATDKREHYEFSVLDLVARCQRAQIGVVELPSSILAKVLLGIVSWTPYWYDPDGPLAPEDLATMLAGRAIATLFPAEAVAGLPDEPLELPQPRWTGNLTT